MQRVLFLLFISFLSLSSHINTKENIGYDFSQPDATLILPPVLHEISGLTYIDSSSFACIEDEDGILFIYDISKNKIRQQYTFGLKGDYEEITKVDSNMYVLRSDGVLIEIINYRSPKFKVKTYVTGIPASNNEGLCLDKENDRLLIGCKSKVGKGPQYKDTRYIYSFDLKTKRTIPKPAFEFDVPALKQFALRNNIRLPLRTKKNGPAEPILKFGTSAICLHPVTKKLYLLSATDHLLFIFNMNGAIEHVQQLDPLVYNKSEGITFFDNGDMLITNEGQSKTPTLLRLNYKK